MSNVLIVESGFYSNRRIVAVFEESEKEKAEALCHRINLAYDPSDPDNDYSRILTCPVGVRLDLMDQNKDLYIVRFKKCWDPTPEMCGSHNKFHINNMDQYVELMKPEIIKSSNVWEDFEVPDIDGIGRWSFNRHDVIILPNGLNLQMRTYQTMVFAANEEEALKIASDTFAPYLSDIIHRAWKDEYKLVNIKEAFAMDPPKKEGDNNV
jgi:hypothetical protein